MKLLFDQNLSRHLPSRLRDLFPDSTHVIAEELKRATDLEIWKFAQTNGDGIVAHDVDFSERSKILGAPPKIVWLRCGNVLSRQIEETLRKNSGLLEELARDEALRYVELF